MTLEQISQKVAELIPGSQQEVHVGYSGGLDSAVLLYAVVYASQNLRDFKVVAVHVNHGLSRHADDWQQHCQNVCQKLNIDFVSRCVVVNNESRTSLEATAREARYQVFDDIVPKNGLLLLGQHANDQAETFMLQLKRGAGPKGLSSMTESGWRNNYRLLRPLLACSRQQLNQCASELPLNWIEDESNLDQSFDRNFLRHSVMPELETRWPGFLKAVNRSARLCAEQQSLLEKYVRKDLDNCLSSLGNLDIPRLKQFELIQQKALIRLWLKLKNHSLPSESFILEIINTVVNAQNDRQPLVSWAGKSVRRYNGELWLVADIDLKQLVNIDCTRKKQVYLPQSLGVVIFGAPAYKALNADKNDCIEIRFGQPVKNIKSRINRRPFSLKNYFKESKVPVWERPLIPQLFINDEFVQLFGHFVTEYLLSNNSEGGLLTEPHPIYVSLCSSIK